MAFSVGPDGPPTNVRAAATSPTTISVLWHPVNEIDRNGIINTHEITYTPQQTFGGAIREMKVNSSNSTFVIQGLEEFVNYTVSVVAYTAIGGGPSSPEDVVTTFQNGKHICV